MMAKNYHANDGKTNNESPRSKLWGIKTFYKE